MWNKCLLFVQLHISFSVTVFLFAKANFKEDNRDRICVCVSVCVYVCVCVCVCVSCVRACVSLASDSSDTIKVIISKLARVTASDMKMLHVLLILLTLTFIQGHTHIILNVRLFQKVFQQCSSRLLLLECRVVVTVVVSAGQEQSSQAFGERDANNQQNQSCGNIFY